MKEKLQELIKFLLPKRGTGKKYLSFKVKPDTLSKEYIDEPIVYLSQNSCRMLGISNNDIVTISFKNIKIPARVKSANNTIIGLRYCQLNLLTVQALDILPGNLINITPPESVVLLVDTSKSMLGLLEDKQQKANATKEAIRTLIENKITLDENDLISIVTFGEKRVVVDLTDRLESLLYKVGKIDIGGGTYMYGGIKTAMKLLSESKGLKRIILITDGVPSSTGKNEILKLMEEQVKGDIIIDTVGVGNRQRAVDNIKSLNAYNEDFLRNISALTGGQFTFVYNIEKFKKDFEKLAQIKRFYLPLKHPAIEYVSSNRI